jgi:hypothetical protein
LKAHLDLRALVSAEQDGPKLKLTFTAGEKTLKVSWQCLQDRRRTTVV